MIYTMPNALIYPNENLSVANIISQMGVTVGSPTFMGSPSQEYYNRAYITQGKRSHGDSCPSAFVNALASGPSSPLATSYWDYGSPWVSVGIGNTNTTTNARIVFGSIEAYILKLSTNQWVKLEETDGNLKFGLNYYSLTAFGASTVADAKATGRTNIPGFNVYSDNATRNAPNAVTTNYRVMHNTATGRKALPGGGVDFGGLFVTCKVKVVPEIYGAALNGVTALYASVGFDFFPNATQQLNTGEMINLGYWPGSGESEYLLLPTDGSWQRLYYIPYMDDGAFVANTSAYAIANNKANLCFTEVQITANPPQLLPNSLY